MFFALSLGLAALLHAEPAHADTAPDGVAITAVRASGTGCNFGAAQVALAPDASGLSLSYAAFDLVGQAVPRVRIAKACAVTVDVAVPLGWSVGASNALVMGSAELARGSTASIKLTTSVQGALGKMLLGNHTFKGSFAGDYVQQADAPMVLFSPCTGTKRTLRFDTAIALLGEGTLKGTPFSGGVEEQIGLQWQRCEPPPPTGDEVRALSVPQGMWDGNLNVCIDLKNGTVFTQQLGVWTGFVDLQFAVETFDGNVQSVVLQGPAGTANAQIVGDWHRVKDATPSLTSFNRDGRGDDPQASVRVQGTKRCFRLIDGGQTRPGPVTFTANYDLVRSDW